jgi:hypothetical protein
LKLRAGEQPERDDECSNLELICVAADAGVEPATFRLEVSHSHATNTVTNCNLRGLCGRVVVFHATVNGRKYPEPSPPEIVSSTREDRARLYCFPGFENSSGVEPLRLMAYRKYPHTAPLALVSSQHGGTIAMRWFHLKDEVSASFTTHGCKGRQAKS